MSIIVSSKQQNALDTYAAMRAINRRRRNELRDKLREICKSVKSVMLLFDYVAVMFLEFPVDDIENIKENMRVAINLFSNRTFTYAADDTSKKLWIFKSYVDIPEDDVSKEDGLQDAAAQPEDKESE
jgi:sugar-specific transcriptional regulator TrmB